MEPIDVYFLIIGSMIVGITALAFLNNHNNKKRHNKKSR